MNIRDLKYLVALADVSHFGKAAEVCFVSQPALSMQIKKLEIHLGVKLLERTNKSVMLTTSGALIAERARHILSQIEEVREIAKTTQDPLAGEIKIGIFPTLAPYLLPLIIPSLVKKFPKLSFYLIENTTVNLVEKLKEGKLHAALLATPIVDAKFKHALLFEEEFLLTVPVNHQLAKLKNIKQHHLDNINLLLLDEGHCMRDQALSVCHRMNVMETQNFRATSIETLRHMVTAGVGITLMPQLACMDSKHLTYVPFEKPKPSRTIGLYWRASTSKQILLDKLVSEIKKIMQQNKSVRVINS